MTKPVLSTDKRLMTFKLSQESRDRLAQVAEQLGVSKTAIVEMAIRRFAASSRRRN